MRGQPKLRPGGAREALLRVLDDMGACTREELAEQLPEVTGVAIVEGIRRLTLMGLARNVLLITAQGREAIQQIEIESDRPPTRRDMARDRAISLDAYPLASTDEQIDEIRRKAQADRTFGHESINQRGLTARK